MLSLKQHKHAVWPGFYAESFHMMVELNPRLLPNIWRGALFFVLVTGFRFAKRSSRSIRISNLQMHRLQASAGCWREGAGLIHHDCSRSRLYQETSHTWRILKLNGFVVPRTSCGEPRVGSLLIYHRGTFTSACRESSRCSWFGAADSGSLSSESRRSWNS